MNQGSYDLRRDVDRLKNKTDELAKDYYIQVNSPIVTYKDEVYTPSTIVATAYQSSREITDFYDDGILDLWVSTNGGNSYTYVKQTTSHTISAVINDTTITNYRINLYDEELNLLDRQTIVIVRTTKGSAGQGYDFIYYTTEKESLSQSDYPSGDITKLVGNFNEWLQSPKAIDTLHPNVFMSYRTSDEEGHWGNWSTPVKYNARGERGEDGEGLEMIFCRTEYADDYPIDPSTLDPVLTDDYYPDGWFDDQQGVNSQYCFEYVSMRTKEVPTGSKEAQWGKFSPPKLWATFSEDGKDGKGIELIFARNNDPTTAPTFLNNQDKKTYTGTVNNKHFYDDDFVPQNWTDDQTGVDVNNQCEWVAKRIKKVSNGVASWESFNAPQLWATFSEDGEDGKDAITVMLGNEAQLIAVNGNGTLKSNPTVITIPVYCYKGISRTAGTISLSSVSNTFSTKTITRQPTSSNDGLITLQCTSVPSQITKDEPITITVDGKTYTKYFTWSKIGDGKDGNDGGTYDFVYYTKNDGTVPTISSSTTINANTGRNVVGEWCARPTNVSSSYQYCFGAYRELDYKGDATGNYSDVYIWAKYGVNGSSGTSHEYAYYTTSSATAPTKPTGDVTATSGTNKWTTVPVAMTSTNKYMYISYRINGGTWSNTALWSQFGDKGDKGDAGARGKDGIGLEHIFYRTTYEITDWNTVSSNNNPQKWTVQPDTDDYLPVNTDWTDDATGVDETYKFEYCSIRTKTPNSSGVGKWGAFGEPSLWAKFGEDGENGADGEGLEMIFCRTTTPNGYPSDPSTLPAIQSPDYVPSGWTDDQTGVDVNHQYEYVCMRTKIPDPNDTTGKSLIWDTFKSPSLWAKFGEDGEQGIPGVDGDGVSITGVMTKVADSNLTNTGVGSMADSVPSDYVASTVYSINFTKGSANCVTPSYLTGSGNVYVERQGNIVVIYFNNLQLSNSFPVDSTSSGHQNIFTLPNWAKPSKTIYFASVLDNSVLSCTSEHIRIRRLSNATNMTGTVTYMVDSDVGKANTTLSFVSTSAVNTGGYIQAKILSGSTPLDGVILYFRINDVVYKRITGDNGIASLNINLPSGSYPVAVWFDGGEYDSNHQYKGEAGNYKYAQATNTFTVNKASTVNITFDSSNSVDDNHYAQFNNTASGSYPMRNHTVYLNVGGSGWRSAETDGDGRVYFRLNGYSGSTTVQAKINASTRVTTGKTSSKTYTIS